MTRVIEFIIAVLIVVALFVLFGLFLPASRTVTHSTETNHPVRQVFDTLNGFERFGEWNPMRAHDPKVAYEVSGPRKGEGARLEYSSENEAVGSGSLEIVESVEDTRIVIEEENDNYGTDKTHTIEFEESSSGKTLTITHTYRVDYGWNLLGRFAGMYVSRNVGDDVKRGLANLSGLIATMPNFDYSKLEIGVARVEPVNTLFVQTTADRNITAVQVAQDDAMKAIRAAIQANDLEEAGAPRLITTNFGNETYDFDVAIPVRKPVEGEDEAASEDEVAAAEAEQEALDAASEQDTWSAGDGDDAVAEADPCAEPVQPPPAIEGVEVKAPVQFGPGYGGCALMAEYIGHPAALPLVRDMLRSYAASHGYQIHERAFEEYLSPFEELEMGSARFHVYWPVQHPANPAPAPAPAADAAADAVEGEGAAGESQADEDEAQADEATQ